MKIEHITKRFVAAIVGIFALLMMVSLSTAQNVSESELQFREAQHKQTVEGDLSNAIKIYQNIVSSKTADRAVKAKALLQLAACYEKLGQKSETTYQQIVRDFSDQPAATQARAKLAALRPPVPTSTMTVRKIDMGESLQNVVATDGQRAVYWDRVSLTLYIGDIAGKDKRAVYKAQRMPRTVVSRDLSMVLFYFLPSPQEAGRYAVMKTDGSGFRDLVLTDKGEKIPALQPGYLTWSWDNRYLLMCNTRPDRTTQLLKISVADGAVQDILRGRETDVAVAEFSPDGRFIAYRGGSSFGNIRVVSAQGGESQLVVETGVLGDWSRDGKYLMVFEVRSGARQTMSLVPIQNGQRSGASISMRTFLPFGIPHSMSNGTTIVNSANRVGRVLLGTIDSRDPSVTWKLLELVDPGASLPTWSPDSQKIGYVARVNSSSRVRVRDVTTGDDRELHRASGLIVGCLWAHQKPNIYCADRVGLNTEMISVPVDSGRAEKVGTLDGIRSPLRLTPDDRFLKGTKFETRAVFEWEIGTDHEIPGPNFMSSADGRWLLDASTRDAQNRQQIRVRPSSSDENNWKVLAHWGLPPLSALGPIPISFAPDGKWVFYHDRDPDGRSNGLYRVSTTEGEPERLGDYPTSSSMSYMSISPDGHQVIVETFGNPQQQPEFWAIENLIPTAKAATK
jgi:Tol biopolymer transport system component